MKKKLPEIIHVDKSSPKRYAWEGNKTIQNVVRNLASAGLPNEEIANLIGVRLATLERRIRSMPEIEEALIAGRSHATQVIVAEMFKAAVGGHVYQEITETISATGKKSTKVVTKETLPDSTLMMYWLNNNDPENWKTHRQLNMEAKGSSNDGKIAESDKIARLSREVFDSHPVRIEGEHRVSEETPYTIGEGANDAGDLQADVPGETTDNLQDDVLDVPTEEGAESL